MTSGGVRSYGDCVREFLIDEGEERLASRVSTADFRLLAAIVDELHDLGRSIDVDLLCTPAVLDRLDAAFPVASRARDLEVDGAIAVRRVADDDRLSTVLRSADRCVTVLRLGGSEVATVEIGGEASRDRLERRYERQWTAAAPHALDAPPYSKLVERVEAELGEDVRSEFVAGIEGSEARAPGDRTDPIPLALVLAARHEREFRSVVEWATATRLASQGTVSRAKQRLESAGLLATEPVKQGVGRPRQRLVLAEESLRSTPVETLVDAIDAASR